MKFARSLTAALALALVASGAFAAPGKDGGVAHDAKSLQQLYMQFLDNEGFNPRVDSDGDVQFKAEGKTYFIDVTESDLQYFNLVLPNIWPIESEEERIQVLRANDEANRTCKATKMYMVRDNVWVGIELFVETPEDFKDIFRRSMTGIQCGVRKFVEKMRSP